MTDSETAAPARLAPVWVVIPAAGRGSRMATTTPKQYLPLAGKTVLEVTLDKFSLLPQVAGVVLAVNNGDRERLDKMTLSSVHTTAGGADRAESVVKALDYLRQQGVDDRHWVMVHDAARPCVRPEAIARLRRTLETEPGAVGGILAKPVADTLKQVKDGKILSTTDRSTLWQAHTPQMFRLGDLREALSLALAHGRAVTDEASALEHRGARPLVVEDWRDNIKITHPEDLALAELILQRQMREAGAD